MGNQRQKKQPTMEQKKARKAHKRAVRTATDTTVPGTNTRENQCLQIVRWLRHEGDAPLKRYSRDTIHEVERTFSSNPAVRAANPYASLSVEGKRAVATMEQEREEAREAGFTEGADWWAGEKSKGTTVEMAKAFKEERERAKAAAMVGALEKGENEEAMLGLGVEEDGIGELGAINATEEAAGLGAMTAEEMGLGPRGFEDLGFVSCEDDDLAEEEQEGGQTAGKGGEMEGVEEAKGDETAMDLD
ncbi:MAG: hypothetical protein Q9207_006427 [Kuettlingeria erythrocarpa]